MIVLFRSSEAAISAGSHGDETREGTRWNGKHKLEIIRKCYLSIQSGLDENDKLIVVNDRTTDETLEWMRENTKADFGIKNIRPMNELRKTHPYPNYHPVLANSCPDLMEFLVELASLKIHQNELIYVCEDDYLHIPNAINCMKAVFQNNYGGFYAPYDYPDRYYFDSDRNCELVLTTFGHLRTIPSATLTIAALGATWFKYKFELLRAGAFADDTWTWKAFKQVGALCPIPGHATHLQDGCVTPLVPWEKVYDSISTSS